MLCVCCKIGIFSGVDLFLDSRKVCTPDMFSQDRFSDVATFIKFHFAFSRPSAILSGDKGPPSLR